jgi:hypothetical protein
MRVWPVAFAALAMVGAPGVSAQSLSPRVLQAEPLQGFSPTSQTAPATIGVQTAPENQQRVDPWRSFAPVTPGFTAGSVTFYPSVTGGVFYDDNVFATHDNRQASWAGFVRPELGVRATGPNYAVEAKGFVESRWYSRFSSEDQVNGAAALAATIMPDKDTQVILKAGYARAHEERGTGESIVINNTPVFTGFDRPVGFNTYELAGTLNKRFNRWWTSFGAAGTWVQYDTPTILGIPIPQDYRDGLISVVSGRVGYVVAPLTSVFVEAAGNRRDFQVGVFDSTGYRVVGGVLLEQGPGARIKGEAYAGYMYQNYTGATFQTVSTFTYGGALAMLLAPRWTAVVTGRRDALESALTLPATAGVSVIQSQLAGRIDYQILPNVIVGAGATWLSDEFLGANRTDTAVGPLVSVKYLMSPNVTLGFDYRNVTYDSTGAGVLGYYRNVYLFSIHAQL